MTAFASFDDSNQMSPWALGLTLTFHRMWLRGEPGGCRADLSDAKLSGASLTDANLSGANLCRADLYRADLYRADLCRADLSGANLSDASLTDANLSGANLRGANLSGAKLSASIGIPFAAVAWSGHGECGRQLLGVVIFGKTRLFCGCFAGTVADLREYIERGNEKHRASRTKALDFVLSCLEDGGAK